MIRKYNSTIAPTDLTDFYRQQEKNSIYRLITPYTPVRTSQDIQRFRTAVRMAESDVAPDFYELFRLYKDIGDYGYVMMGARNRALNVFPSEFYWKDAAGNILKTDPIKKHILRQFFLQYLDSVNWGVNILEVLPGISADRPKIQPIPNYIINPKFGIIYPDIMDKSRGISYNEPNLAVIPMEAGNLGLYNNVAIFYLWSKNVLGFWAEFTEIFGMPLRVVTTESRESNRIDQLDKAMQNMGSAAYAILQGNEKIDLHSNSQASGEVYDKMAKRLEDAIIGIMAGQTMTMTSGSSYSQSQTHQQTSEQIALMDMMQIETVINEKLVPLLYNYGWITEAAEFQFYQKSVTDPNTWQRDLAFLNHFEIDLGYFEQKYRLPLLGLKEAKKPE